MLAGITLICIIVTCYNVQAVRWEQHLKQTYGYGLSPSCIRLEGSMTGYILSLAFLGSFIGNAFGLGGGFIYNPV